MTNKEELKLARINESYHRKYMEYYLEQIKILKELKKQESK